jgi:hypothetical protein
MGVSNLGMAAAMASLTDEEHKRSSKQKNEEVRKYTAGEMKKEGIDSYSVLYQLHFLPVKELCR